MKKSILLIVFYLIQSSLFSNIIPACISYLDPLPGANYVEPGTSIIIKPVSAIGSFQKEFILKVNGSKSGIHECKVIISDDNETLIYKPITKFSPGENITVSFSDNGGNNKVRHNFSYTFNVSSENVSSFDPVYHNQNPLMGELSSIETNRNGVYDPNPLNINGLPDIVINNSSEPTEGYIFISNFAAYPQNIIYPFLLILDNTTHAYFSKEM